MEELGSSLAAAQAALKEKEEELAKTAQDKDQAIKLETSAKEDLEVKVNAASACLQLKLGEGSVLR